MLSNKAIKIFIEPDEEIVFIIEKIRNADSDRVIMIVPHTAVLISSAVSLKLLSRQILKTEKLVVLVSDTALAKSLGSKAQLMVCAKVSEVTKDVWLAARDLKTKLADELNRVKHELLSARQEPPADPLRVEDLLKKVLPKKSESKDKAVGLSTKPETVKAVIVDEPEAKQVVIKPRLKERVLDINGIKLVAGGDILNNEELLNMERNRLNQVLEINLEREDNLDDNNFDIAEDKEMRKDAGLVGMDVAGQLNENPYMEKSVAKPKKAQPKVFAKIGDFFSNLFAHVSVAKLIGGFFIALLVFFLVSYFFFTSVKVEIEQSATAFTVKKTVTAKVDDKNAYDTEALTIPAQSITKDSSKSSEAEASGEGQTGEYAQGDLLLFNPSASDVLIKAGQVFSYNYNAQPLKFKALQDVTIPAAAPKTATVKVKAESFGEQYNIPTTLKNFLVEGNPGMSAQNITAISGGTTVATKVVSKENIDDLKLSMIEELKTDLLNALKSTLGEDDILVEGSESFTENSFTTDIPENTPAETFKADLKMTVSAVIISKTVLKEMLTEVAKAENGYSKVELKEPVVEDVSIAEKVVTFESRANAVGMTELDVAAVREQIKGKSVSEARDMMRGMTGVSNVYVQFTPPYIPLPMQQIPTDDAKLSISTVSK